MFQSGPKHISLSTTLSNFKKNTQWNFKSWTIFPMIVIVLIAYIVGDIQDFEWWSDGQHPDCPIMIGCTQMWHFFYRHFPHFYFRVFIGSVTCIESTFHFLVSNWAHLSISLPYPVCTLVSTIFISCAFSQPQTNQSGRTRVYLLCVWEYLMTNLANF